MDDPPSGNAKQLPRPPSPNSSQGAANLVFDVSSWHPKSVKRPRPVKSCTECRRRKLKCDRRCPCSQCQRSSYRVCTYGSSSSNGGTGSGESGSRSNDPNNPNGDSDGSEGSEVEDESAAGSISDERPLKQQRHLSNPSLDGSVGGPRPHPAESTGSGPNSNHGYGSGPSSGPGSGPGSGPLPSRGPSHYGPAAHPPSNSSLSILLNPTSPSTHGPNQPAPADYAQPQYGARLPAFQQSGPLVPSIQPAPSGSSSSATAAAASPIAAQGVTSSAGLPPAMKQISSTLENPEHWMSLNGDELREYTAALTKEFMARMERLEKLVLAKNASALTAIPPFPSSTMLSQLHRRYNPQDPRHQVIDASSTTMRSLSIKGNYGMRTRYFGQNSTRVLLNLFDDAKDFVMDAEKRLGASDLLWRLEQIHNALQEDHLAILKPITVYVDSMMPLLKRMADVIPRRDVCDRLFHAYVNVSEGLYRVIHVPTFQDEIERYWANGINPSMGGVTEDFLPRYLATLCIGGRFEADSKGLSFDRSDGVHIPTACALVRSWLDSVRGKPSVDVNILRTEVLLLHAARMIAPRSQRLWTELGMIARLAMVMGLHRDPEEFAPDISPFEAECRRKLWFTIIDMDLHVSLASNLPSALRPGEFTCQPPRNLDDADIYPKMPALPTAKPMDQYTEGQMQRFAADTLPLRMRANDLLCHIDSLTDYGEVLAVGGELEKALDDINCLFPRNAVFGNQNKYKEWRMRAMLDMHVRRPLLALYRPFALSASDECPPPSAISDIYLKSSMAMLTYMKELDPTMPGFDDVSHMYYVILRSDIVQAAFSICHYIIQAVEAEGLPTPVTAPSQATKRDMDAPGGYSDSDRGPAAGNGNGSGNGNIKSGSQEKPRLRRRRVRVPLIWTSAYMIHTVEHTIENLARLVSDLSFDLRDVIALATVLGSVMPAADQAERNAHIRAQMARVHDTCVDKLRSHTSPVIRAAIGHTEWYRPPKQREDSDLWDTSFWDLWESH